MFLCQSRIWFVLTLLEKWVSCLNKLYREVFLPFNFLPAALCLSVIFFEYITVSIYVRGYCEMLCVWVCLWVYSFVCIHGILPQRKGRILVLLCVQKIIVPPSVCQCLTLKIWVCWRMWHLTLLTGADCFTAEGLTLSYVCVHTHSRWQSGILCPRVCHNHTSASHWGPPTPKNACTTTMCKQDHLEVLLCGAGRFSALQSDSHDDTRVLVIHQRKFWPVCGMNEFYGGGSELRNHTLHSPQRNLITSSVFIFSFRH